MKNYKKIEYHYVECLCSSCEHVIRFVFDPNEDYGDIWTEIYLNHYHKWYKRIWIAIKYIFGYQSKFGAFDCTLIKPEHYSKIEDLFKRSREAKDGQKR
jgi:hypothetical protein